MMQVTLIVLTSRSCISIFIFVLAVRDVINLVLRPEHICSMEIHSYGNWVINDNDDAVGEHDQCEHVLAVSFKC